MRSWTAPGVTTRDCRASSCRPGGRKITAQNQVYPQPREQREFPPTKAVVSESEQFGDKWGTAIRGLLYYLACALDVGDSCGGNRLHRRHRRSFENGKIGRYIRPASFVLLL